MTDSPDNQEKKNPTFQTALQGGLRQLSVRQLLSAFGLKNGLRKARRFIRPREVMIVLALMPKGWRAVTLIKVKPHCAKDAKEADMYNSQSYKVWTSEYLFYLTPHL